MGQISKRLVWITEPVILKNDEFGIFERIYQEYISVREFSKIGSIKFVAYLNTEHYSCR